MIQASEKISLVVRFDKWSWILIWNTVQLITGNVLPTAHCIQLITGKTHVTCTTLYLTNNKKDSRYLQYTVSN